MISEKDRERAKRITNNFIDSLDKESIPFKFLCVNSLYESFKFPILYSNK